MRLKAVFPNDQLQLWPGQFTNVRVLINTLRQVVVVPTAAVQRGPTGTYVYVVKDNSTVTVRPITVTQQDDQQAVIAAGLVAGEVVVTTGFARLAEGTTVSVSSPEEPGPVGQGNGGGKAKASGKRAQVSGGAASTTP